MRWRGVAAGLALMTMVSVSGKSCGPFFVEALFVRINGPDDLEGFMEGKPQVVQREFYVTNLALAYRMMSGPALTPEERKSVLTARRSRSYPPETPSEGITSWMKVSQTLRNGLASPPPDSDRKLPGNDWQTYPNCPDNAYAVAARTLSERVKLYPQAKPELVEWLRGQAAVFSNCSGPAQMPAEVPASSAVWLRKDRVYQTAAAHFYRMEWSDAMTGFESVAADKASPWHDLGQYLVARCLIREATLGATNDRGFDEAPLREAQERLKSVASRGGPYARNAADLLNLVDLRLAPGKTAARLGDSIRKPDPQLGQNLIDLDYAFDHMSPEERNEARTSDLADWILSMRAIDGEDHSAARWRQTHSLAWLVAAMTHLEKPDAELMQAAADVPPSSPAWATVTYVRLRLMSGDAAAQTEVKQALGMLAEQHATGSTVNLFNMLAQNKAQSLSEYAALAPMQPGEFYFDDGDMVNAEDAGAKQPTMAGLPVNTGDVKRLDVESATVFNERLPLSELVQLVLDSTWPKQLRFELAMAVWTRAVLLDKPKEARRLTPEMIEGEPGWKPWLTAYDAATTEDERTVTGLLALMRFPSVRPYVNGGAGREEGFVGYSSYRDNWWCANMGKQQDWKFSYSTSYNYRNGAEISSSPEKLSEKLAPFISPAMASEAQEERARLEKIGDAPTYFGKEALAWVKTHPQDPRNAELLGFAFRAMRNGCNIEASTGTRHQVFETLHAKYPHSEWATRYPKFEMDEQ
jgi:hypothetical protein